VEAHFLTDLAAGLLLGASIGAACRAAARQELG
jgi:membrane-associated phospholipid phosphatase